MSTPIYQLFILRNHVASALARKSLAEAEKKALSDKEATARKASGATAVAICDSAWADEAHPAFGVSVFPNVEANQKVMQSPVDIGWRQYFDSFTLPGIPSSDN